jgi:hypothetical protein
VYVITIKGICFLKIHFHFFLLETTEFRPHK